MDQNLGAPGRSRNGMFLADPITTNAMLGSSNFAASPLFSAGGPSKNDIKQGGVGDCYFMSTLASVARVSPDRVRQLVVDLGDGTYAVHFKGNGGADQFVRVDADLPTSGGALAYSKQGAGGSIWVPIVEKAWTFFRDNKGTYASIAYWHPEYLHSPFTALGLTVQHDNSVASYWNGSTPTSGVALLQSIKGELDAGRAVVLTGPHPLDASTPLTADNYHSFAHAYMVDSVAPDFSSITVRNPYATQGPAGDGYTTISADLAFYACCNFWSLSL
jgi:hypothetical protein